MKSMTGIAFAALLVAGFGSTAFAHDQEAHIAEAVDDLHHLAHQDKHIEHMKGEAAHLLGDIEQMDREIHEEEVEKFVELENALAPQE